MNAENYWKQFVCSGKVEDYLDYARVREGQERNGRQQEQKGDRPYAGNDYGNRNDFKSDAYR